MSTIETIRNSIKSAKATVERALPELGYNDLIAVFDEAEQLFEVLSQAIHARRIPGPMPPQNIPEPPAAATTEPAPELVVVDTAEETPPPAAA